MFKKRWYTWLLGIAILLSVAGIVESQVRRPSAAFQSITVAGQAKFANGTRDAPSIARAATPGMGWYFPSATQMFFTQGDVARVLFDGTDVRQRSGGRFSWSSGAPDADAVDLVLARAAAGQLLLSTDNITTGTGIIGSATIGLKQVFFDYTNTGTVGAVTINKASGRAIIAAGASSVVITNSLVTAAAGCFATLQANDTTGLYVRSCITGAGTMTIATTANATANLPVDFFIVNHD